MYRSLFWRGFASVAMLVLLMTMSLPLTLAPQVAFAQSSTVSINPTQGPAGAQVTGSGTNWTAGDSMQVSWGDNGSILANTTVQSTGSFTVKFNIPSSAGLGGHNIYFTDLTSRYFLVAIFTVGTIDLQTLRIVALQPPTVGYSTTFRAYIRNNGTVASGFFDIQWIADGTNLYGGHYSIPPGATDTHDHIWSNLTAGQHTLTFIANFDHLVPETNYNNNQVTITFKAASFFTYPIASSNVSYKIGYNIHPNLSGRNSCYWDSSTGKYVPWNQLWHSGEDWFAKTSAGTTTISAIAKGVVKYISPSGYSYPGAVIIIQHTLPDNSIVYSMYAHLDPTKILVAVNSTVTKGQAIAGGLIYQTYGGQNNTHLHWEIRYFLDGSGITKGPNYTTTCSGIPAPGYTWPGNPNNFVFGGKTYQWTNPSQFIANHS